MGSCGRPRIWTSSSAPRLRTSNGCAPRCARRTDGDPHIDQISAADLLGEYPAIRYYPPSGDLYFDVLTRLGEFARFENVDAEIKDVAGIRVRVATPAALYRLKKGTVRAKDHQDATALRERFGLDEEG